MKREFIINRQGKDFVLYAGLLDAAHEKGLQSIVTEAISVTANLALFKATATMADGRVFVGHGDATPENVGRNIAPHFVRMGETRAKARALRDALNIGGTALEELGGEDDHEPARPTPIRQRPAQAPVVPDPTHPSARLDRDPALMDEWSKVDAAVDALRGLGVDVNPPTAASVEAALKSFLADARKQYADERAKQRAARS